MSNGNNQNNQNNQNENNLEQIKQQLDERSRNYFAGVNSLPEQEAALSDYKEKADEMAKEIKEKREQLDKQYAEQKQDILDKLDFKNFSKELEENGTYTWGTKKGEQEYMGHTDTKKLLKESRDIIINNDNGPTALTEEDLKIVREQHPDVYGYLDAAENEIDIADAQEKINEIESEYLAQKRSNYAKTDEEMLIRGVYASIQQYALVEQMKKQKAYTEEDKKLKLKDGEQEKMAGILKSIEDLIITNNEIGDFYKNNPNTAKEEYEKQIKAFEQKKEDLEKEHKDLIAEYDKHGLDRSHLDGSKEHREKTLDSLKDLLAAGEHKQLLDKMLEIKNNAAKENSTLFQKAEAKAVDDLIGGFVKVDENNTLTHESEELNKNFLMLFGAMDEGKLHTDKVYSDLRSQIRFNKSFTEANTSTGLKGEEFAKTQLETGKRAGKLASESEKVLDDRASEAEYDTLKLKAFKEKVAKMAESAGKLITQLDRVPKGKKNTGLYDSMHKAIEDVAKLDGSKSPKEVIETIERMNKQAANYEKERKSLIMWTGVGRSRLNISKQAQSLSKGDIAIDINFMSDEFSKDMKVDDQIKEKKGVIDEVKNEKNRRETEIRKAEQKAREAAEKAAKEAKRQEEIKVAKQLEKNITVLRKATNEYENHTFDKLSKEPKKGYTFSDGGVLKIEPDEKFTYTANNTTVKGVYDKELDTCSIYSPDLSKENETKLIDGFRKENKIAKENTKLFEREAKERMIDKLADKSLSQIKKLQKEGLVGDSIKIDKDTVIYKANNLVINNDGKVYNGGHATVKAKLDKKGLVLDNELKEMKQQMDKEKELALAASKKKAPGMG